MWTQNVSQKHTYPLCLIVEKYIFQTVVCLILNYTMFSRYYWIRFLPTLSTLVFYLRIFHFMLLYFKLQMYYILGGHIIILTCRHLFLICSYIADYDLIYLTHDQPLKYDYLLICRLGNLTVCKGVKWLDWAAPSLRHVNASALLLQ